MNSTPTPNVKHDGDGDGDATGTSSKKKHCFNFKKSGKCKAGDDCPFLHDINVTTTKTKHREEEGAEVGKQKDKSQIMCINWKNKGKCRKGEKCPYRHGNSNDPIRGTVVVGKEEGKVANEEIDDGVQTTADTKEKKRKRKENKQRQYQINIKIDITTYCQFFGSFYYYYYSTLNLGKCVRRNILGCICHKYCPGQGGG